MVGTMPEKTVTVEKDRTIVTLCGSTRFYEEYQQANYRETMAGRIVLTVGFYPHSAEQAHGPGIGYDENQKTDLDQLHRDKISLSDEIYVINPLMRTCPSCRTPWVHGSVPGKRYAIRVETCSCGVSLTNVKPEGYIGNSTRNEIAHAVALGKRVRYLVEPDES